MPHREMTRLKPRSSTPTTEDAANHPGVRTEAAGPTSTTRLWTQAEAADYLNVSQRYLRASACPKILLPGTGRHGKPLVRYNPVNVRTWAEQRRATRRFGA